MPRPTLLDLVRPEDNRRQLFDLLARFDLPSGPLAVLVLAAVTTAAPGFNAPEA